MTTDDLDLDELERLERGAFRAPWTYSEWEVECPCEGGSEYDCTNRECDGSHVPCTTIESPKEYPDGQVVAQFQVPGLSCLADKNGAFIVALRNAAPALIAAARELASERSRREGAERELADMRARALAIREHFMTSHAMHWDREGTHGANCPACKIDRETREMLRAIAKPSPIDASPVEGSGLSPAPGGTK